MWGIESVHPEHVILRSYQEAVVIGVVTAPQGMAGAETLMEEEESDLKEWMDREGGGEGRGRDERAASHGNKRWWWWEWAGDGYARVR